MPAIPRRPAATTVAGRTVTTPPDGTIFELNQSDGSKAYISAANFKSWLNTTTTLPITITGLTFTPRSVTAGQPADTLLGTLTYTVSGGTLANPAWTLLTSAGGDLKVSTTGDVRSNVANLPAGTYNFRAQLAATNANSLAADFSVTVSAAVVVSPGVPGTLAIPLRIKATQAMPAGSPVTYFQPIGAGDVPAGSRLTLTQSSGGNVVMQQDQETTWPQSMAVAAQRGTLRGAAISFLTPNAMASGEVANFTVGVTTGAPNRTGHTTVAAVRGASDIYLKLFGLDLGADTMLASFNAITSNLPEANAGNNRSYGVDPSGGWETIRSGPLCVEWLAWGYTGRVGGGLHRWQKVEMWLRQWRDGQREVTAVVSQPNAYQATPGATVGDAVQSRIACHAELWNGADRVHAYSGPDSSRAFDAPANMFRPTVTDASGNRTDGGYFVLPDNADLHWGMGSAITFSGALPTGIDANRAYFPFDYGSSIYVAISPNRHNTIFGDRGSQVYFSNVAASGTVRISPVIHTYPSCAQVLMPEDAWPVWMGGALGTNRPQYLVAHDETYLARRAKAVPPYDPAMTRPEQVANPRLQTYVIGTMTEEMKALDATGDKFSDNRIGYLPVDHAGLIVQPMDARRDRYVRASANQWFGYNIRSHDHRSGRSVVCNAGPGGTNTATYPGMGPNNDSFRMYPINTGNPVWGGAGAWNRDNNDIKGHPGFGWGYTIPLDGSHAPDFSTVPFLRTGNHLYSMIGQETSLAIIYGRNKEHDYTRNGVPYRSVTFNSGRTQGWSLRSLMAIECLTPDFDPVRAMVKEIGDSFAGFYADVAVTGEMRHLGKLFDHGAVGSSAWMDSIFAFCVGMEVWRGTRPQWRIVTETQANLHIAGLDDLNAVPNLGAFLSAYNMRGYNDAQGRFFNTVAEVWGQYAPPPYPANGFVGGKHTDGDDISGDYDTPSTYRHMHKSAQAMMITNHDHGLANIPNARRVRDQIVARCNRRRSPDDYLTAATTADTIYATWFIAPVPAPAAAGE